MDIETKIDAIRGGHLNVIAQLSIGDSLEICQRLRKTEKERDDALAKLAAMESQEPHCYLTGTIAWFRLSDAEHRAKGSRLVTGQDCPIIPLYAKPVPAAKPATEYKGWYCAHCQCGVDSSEVTFNEAHTVCGRIITDDEPPMRADKPAGRITEQDAREIFVQLGLPGFMFGDWMRNRGGLDLLKKLNADRCPSHESEQG